LGCLEVKGEAPKIRAFGPLPVEAKYFDDVSEEDDLFRSRISPRFVDCQTGSCKIYHEVTLWKNTYVKYFHFFYLFLEKSFQDVVVKIDSLGTVSVPLPQIVMKLLNFTILRNFIVKLLLEGVLLARASFAVFLLLPIRRRLLSCFVVESYRLHLVVFALASVLLMPAATIKAMATGPGPILPLCRASVVIVSFVLFV
jgi:hypothetical protein